VDHDTRPSYKPCEEPHEYDTFLYAKEIIKHEKEENKEELSGTNMNNYVGEEMDVLNNITPKTCNVSKEKMK